MSKKRVEEERNETCVNAELMKSVSFIANDKALHLYDFCDNSNHFDKDASIDRYKLYVGESKYICTTVAPERHCAAALCRIIKILFCIKYFFKQTGGLTNSSSNRC